MRWWFIVLTLAVGLGGVADSGVSARSSGGRLVLLYASDWLGPTRLFAVDPSGSRPPGQVTFHRLKPVLCGSAWACGTDDPRPSPDGRMVAYRDSGDLWVARADGSRRSRLHGGSSAAGFVGAYAWSPDSRRIAYSVSRELRIVTASGTDDRLLARVDASALAWSPDGRALAAQDLDRIIVVRGRSVQRLATNANTATPSVAWLRTGRISYLSGLRADTRVVTVGATGLGPLRDLGPGSSSAWTRDGRWLAVSTGTGIELVDPKTLRRRRLTPDRGFDLEWSPDGAQLAYIEGSIDPNEQEENAGDLRTVTRAGRVRTVIAASRRFGGQIVSLAWATPPLTVRYRTPEPDDGVFAGGPVSALAADAGRVAFAACKTRIQSWTPAHNDLQAVVSPPSQTCYSPVRGRIDVLAVSGERVAWRDRGAGIRVIEWSLRARTLSSPTTGLLESGLHQVGRGLWADAIVGAGPLLAYVTPPGALSANLQLVRRVDGVACPCPEIKAAARPSGFGGESLRLLDADDGRLLVRRFDDLVLVLDSSGTTSIAISVFPAEAQLAGDHLVSHVGDELLHHEVVRGALLHRWPLRGEAALQDAAHGLVAYALSGTIHVRRLDDGADAEVATGSLARFFDGGLAYAEGARVRVIPFARLPLWNSGRR